MSITRYSRRLAAAGRAGVGQPRLLVAAQDAGLEARAPRSTRRRTPRRWRRRGRPRSSPPRARAQPCASICARNAASTSSTRCCGASPSRPLRVDALAEPGDDRLARERPLAVGDQQAGGVRADVDRGDAASRRAVRHLPAGERGEQVVDGHVGHARARAHRWPSRRAARRAGSARSAAGRRPGSGSGSVTSSPAPAISPSRSASRSATWSTDAAAGGVDQVRGRLHARELRRRPSGGASRASAACAARRSRRARAARPAATPEERELWTISIPKPSPRRAIAWPMRPQPTIPSVVPASVAAEHVRRVPRRPARPRAPGARPRRCGARSPSSSANAMSAVASVSTSGVLPTGMPRSAGRLEVDVVRADGQVGDRLDRRRGVEEARRRRAR